MANCGAMAEDNIRYLQQGIDLIGRLDDATYTNSLKKYIGSGVGSHLRHCIDHYALFLVGLPTGRIDYDARERDPRVESDRRHAIERMKDIVRNLKGLGQQEADASVAVKLDSGSEADETESWSRSTVKREMHYLLSHTVHHYALIAMALKVQGFDVGPEFGVAPSTLRYHHASLSCAR